MPFVKDFTSGSMALPGAHLPSFLKPDSGTGDDPDKQ
jgi:hypothetical protein